MQDLRAFSMHYIVPKNSDIDNEALDLMRWSDDLMRACAEWSAFRSLHMH